MRIIVLKNGKKITGNTWEEVVQNLKNSTLFFTEQSIEEYMAGVAERAEIREQQMHYTGPESFLQELCRIGVIRMMMG
jgi:hypothetical protein